MDALLKERTLSEVKRLCCAGQLDGPALLGEVIERLRRVVPVEAYCASTKDPATGFITHGLAQKLGGADDIFWSLERLYFEHQQSIRRMLDTNPWPSSPKPRAATWTALPATWSTCARSGSPHEMRGAFASGGYLWGSMDLIRESGSPDFGPREPDLLRCVAPYLGNGLKVAALRTRAPPRRARRTSRAS